MSEPYIVTNENVDPFDVDGTLITHSPPNPYVLPILIPDRLEEGLFIKVWPNHNMIRLMKESHARGFAILVWSKGGPRWATDVLTALDLMKLVTLIIPKPSVYFDDKPVQEWLTYRCFIDPNESYKPLTMKKEEGDE